METVEQRLAQTFNAVFRRKAPFRLGLSRDNCGAWDSLTHVEFLVSIEKAFDLRFHGADAVELTSIAKILDFIDRKNSESIERGHE